MYITQEADYAVRIVYCLTQSGKRRDARSISEEVHVTLRFSLKILGKLSNAGIVKSYKGNRGGYELARPAGEITLQDVLAAVDGPYAIARCINEDECNRGMNGNCAVQNAFKSISASVNEQLAKVNFVSIMENQKCQ